MGRVRMSLDKDFVADQEALLDTSDDGETQDVKDAKEDEDWQPAQPSMLNILDEEEELNAPKLVYHYSIDP